MLLGCESPRIFTPPARPLTPETSAGFAIITFAETILGITLHPWQKWFLIHAFELSGDGSFRFRTVVLLVARQNGKSTILQIVALFFMFVRGVRLVISTAQNLDIAEEVWSAAVEIAEGVPELDSEIESVVRVNGKKALILTSGERWKVQASNRRGGRGLSGDLVEMDELREHRDWESWGAITKTTMARAYALILAASNAGDDQSVVLWSLVVQAHRALGNPDDLDLSGLSDIPDDELDGDDLGLFDWSAAPGCDIWDRRAWAQANPSLGYSITERAIASAARTDPEAVFRTEVLCQWVRTLDPPVMPVKAWESRRTMTLRPERSLRFAVDADPDQVSASIGLCGKHDAGETVELFDQVPGLGSVVPRMVEIRDEAAKDGVSVDVVGVDPSSTAGSLIEPLQQVGFTVVEIVGREMGQACASFYTGIVGSPEADPTTSHRSHPDLDAAVAAAKKQALADGWRWARKNTAGNVSPLVAVTMARWLCMTDETDYDVLDSIG